VIQSPTKYIYREAHNDVIYFPPFPQIYENECGKNKSNENFETTIASKNYDRPKTTRECGIF